MDRNHWCCGLSQKIEISEPKKEKYFQINFIGFEPIYRILFVCFSILSLAFSGYWYCGCLLYLLLKIEVLEQVLTALWKSGESLPFVYTMIPKISGMYCLKELDLLTLLYPASQLVTVFVLGFFIIFIYAVISFAFFHGYFDARDDLFCETLAQCFVTLIREGLLGTLGSVSFISSSKHHEHPFPYKQ